MGITPNTAADLRPDLDFSNLIEGASDFVSQNKGIGSLNFGDTTVPGSSYDMAGVNSFTVPGSTYDMAGVNEFPSTTPPVRDDNIPLSPNLNFGLPIDQYVEIKQSDIDLMKTRGGKFLDYDTFKTISGNDSLTREEHAKLKATV